MDAENNNVETDAGTTEAKTAEAEEKDADALLLGGNIELSGFRELDGVSMIVFKKIVGNYAKRYAELGNFEKLSIKMKPVHKKEKSEKYELHGSLKTDGRHFHAEAMDRNLYFALDKVLKRLESEAEPKGRFE